MKIIIVVPCHNEEAVLDENIRLILDAVKKIPHEIKIVISDNNSKDGTAEIGKKLALENNDVDYVFVGESGKGAAVMEAWKKYDADIYGFMDADLATDLSALPKVLKYFEEEKSLPTSLFQREEKLLPPLEEEGGGYDIVVGSRRIAGAEVKRELYRKFTSSILNAIVRILLKTKIKDTPCGFKFMRKAVVEEVAPQVRDRRWVFDTELLILAERARLDSDESKRAGFKIKEIPVKWRERGERKSGVNIYPTAREYIKKILDLRRRIKSRY